VVQILPSANCARPRPALRKSRERHNLCVGSIVDVLAATFPVHRCSTPRLPPVLPPLLRCLFLFFITPAQMHVRHGRWHLNFVWHPGSECQTQPIVASIPFLAKLFLSFPPAQRLGFSQIAPSVVPVLCVPACRHSFPPAKRRAGSSSIPTSLSRSTRVSRQHTVRLGRLSAMPEHTPPLASLCFLWLLPVAARHLPKSPCRMRHMEQTRRVAVDNHNPHDLLAANPCPGSACAYCRANHQFPIPSLLLPPVSPVVDSSAIHPLQNKPCSTYSHHRCWPPAGHAAASPPRLPTTLTGAPFCSTTVYMSPFPQSQPSSRFPSHLLIAHHPLHP
jgi:hypothetical protein